MCLRASQKTGSAPAATGDRLDDEQQDGARPEPPQRREQRRGRVEVRAEPRDLLAVDVGHREQVRRAPSTRPPASCCRGRSGRSRRRGAGARRGAEAAREGGAPTQSRRPRGVIAPSELARSARASAPEHVLARLRAVGREPASPIRCASAGSAASRRRPPRARRGRPAGRAARSRRREQLAAAGVSAVTSGVPQASAWNALFGITRAAFARRAEDPERTAGALVLARQLLVLDPVDPLDVRRAARSSSASSWPLPTIAERELRREPRRREDRLEAVQRDQLADEERAESSAAATPGRKSRSSAPTKQTATRSAGRSAELGEEARVAARCRRRRGRRGGARAGRPGAGRRAAGEPGPKRPRSSTSVSWRRRAG